MNKIILFLSLLLQLNILAMKTKAPIGMQNLGNTCYMNAVLQCLYQIQPLTDFMLSTDAYYKPDSVAAEYADLIKYIQNTTEKTVAAKKFCIPVFKDIFFGAKYQQEDAGSFLTNLLSHLEDYDIIKSKKYKKNPVKELIFGKVISTIMPEGCPVSSLEEIFGSIILEVKSTLTESLYSYIKPKKIIDGYIYKGKSVEAYLEVKISKTKQYLILQLNRYSHNLIGGVVITTKNTDPVKFPLKDLDLKNYMLDPKSVIDTKYDLISFVQHRGSLTSGHYTSYVKHGDKWFYCNDSCITPVSNEKMEEIAQNGNDGTGFTPYLLFYKRQTEENIVFDLEISDLVGLTSSLQGLAAKTK